MPDQETRIVYRKKTARDPLTANLNPYMHFLITRGYRNILFFTT